ncbi:MAG TPA: hypothetical protein VN651_11005 [Gemmatimonadaceae bacterium]|nr:hypothetical protein [Gemmatimonadaceae bacterium]
MATTQMPDVCGSRPPFCYQDTPSYPIDARIDAFVDSAVANYWEQGETLDDTIDLVAALVRTTAPVGLPETDPDWEVRWRTYFAFYDHAVMRGIRTYVEYSNAPTSTRTSH